MLGLCVWVVVVLCCGGFVVVLFVFVFVSVFVLNLKILNLTTYVFESPWLFSK